MRTKTAPILLAAVASIALGGCASSTARKIGPDMTTKPRPLPAETFTKYNPLVSTKKAVKPVSRLKGVAAIRNAAKIGLRQAIDSEMIGPVWVVDQFNHYQEHEVLVADGVPTMIIFPENQEFAGAVAQGGDAVVETNFVYSGRYLTLTLTPQLPDPSNPYAKLGRLRVSTTGARLPYLFRLVRSAYPLQVMEIKSSGEASHAPVQAAVDAEAQPAAMPNSDARPDALKPLGDARPLALISNGDLPTWAPDEAWFDSRGTKLVFNQSYELPALFAGKEGEAMPRYHTIEFQGKFGPAIGIVTERPMTELMLRKDDEELRLTFNQKVG